MKLILSAFLFAFSLLCKGQTQTHDLSTDKIVNENYSFQVVQTADSYGNKTGDFIFYSEPDFIDFCNATFGLDSKIPFIDFNEETAVVIFKGLSKSTAKPFVDSAVETEHYIKLNVKSSESPKGVVNKTAKNIYLIVKVKKSNKEIKTIRW